MEVILTDIPRREGGGSHWHLQRTIKSFEWNNDEEEDGEAATMVEDGGESVLQLAHAALGLAVSSSEKGLALDQLNLDDLVRKAKVRRLFFLIFLYVC